MGRELTGQAHKGMGARLDTASRPPTELSQLERRLPVKVVVDANVFFGAMMDSRSAASRVLGAWRAGRFELVASTAILRELTAVLTAPPPGGRVPARQTRAQLLAAVRDRAHMVDPTGRVRIEGISPADNRLLEAAAAAGADYIVTSDRPLLALRSYGPARIVTPADFMACLE